MEDDERTVGAGTLNSHSRPMKAGGLEGQSANEAAAFLAAIVESSDDAIISKSLQGIITTWNLSAQRLFGYTAAEAVGRPITILIPEDRLGEEPALLARINAGERVDHFETIRRRKDGTLIDISLTISPIRDCNGAIIGASKIARDISERKHAAEHQHMLLREMHHRVKNVFAICSSLITLAARTAQTPAELATSMKNRLVSLARAHEMTLTTMGGETSTEQPTTLFMLLSKLLSAFEDNEEGRWRLHGDDTPVSADRVTSLALLFHEYATNAVKYGALSSGEGRLDVTLVRQPDGFELQWLESMESSSTVGPTESGGFGTTLETMLIRTLHAKVSKEWRSAGLMIRLTLPHDALATDHA